MRVAAQHDIGPVVYGKSNQLHAVFVTPPPVRIDERGIVDFHGDTCLGNSAHHYFVVNRKLRVAGMHNYIN